MIGFKHNATTSSTDWIVGENWRASCTPQMALNFDEECSVYWLIALLVIITKTGFDLRFIIQVF